MTETKLVERLTKAQRDLLQGLAESPRYVALRYAPLGVLLSRGFARHTGSPWMWRRPETCITEAGRQALKDPRHGE